MKIVRTRPGGDGTTWFDIEHEGIEYAVSPYWDRQSFCVLKRDPRNLTGSEWVTDPELFRQLVMCCWPMILEF